MPEPDQKDSVTSSSTNRSEMHVEYTRMLSEQQAIVRRHAGRWSAVGYLRGILFLLAFASLLMGVGSVLGFYKLWFVIAGVLALAFFVVVFIHEGMQTEMKRAQLLSEMHTESIARLERNWSKIKTREVDFPAAFIPVSTDLDLFGETSLYKLLGTARTPLGYSTLRDWIITGAQPAEVELRQVAVKELAANVEWRQNFRLKSEQLADSQSGPSKFVEWCESPSWFTRGGTMMLWVARTLTAVVLVSFVLMLFNLAPFYITIPAIVLCVLINFFIAVFKAGAMHDIFNMVASRRDDVDFYVDLFDMVSTLDTNSERLNEIQNRLLEGDNDARQHLKSLSLLVWLANMRRHGVMFLFYLLFEFLFLWDVHILERLENWKAKHGTKARAWFEDLGQWESLAALGKLAADHPSWIYPTIRNAANPGETIVSGIELGHPLMDDKRVPNDVIVGPSGTVLLVTGSNMSGKSTLLRSIGVNVVLAQMGGPVCAKEMSLVPLHIESSMRIVDSLADGVSFFMAELKRLKEVVDTARRLNALRDKTMLFLLDEILQGTNSRERQIAVTRVVRKLIDENAIGAISTHDLELGDAPELSKACQPVHFSEQFQTIDGKKQMTFDYKMKTGIAETTNALKLLELVGLGEDD